MKLVGGSSLTPLSGACGRASNRQQDLRKSRCAEILSEKYCNLNLKFDFI